MKIEIKDKVNNNAMDAIAFLTKEKYPNTPMFIGGVGGDKFPTIGTVFASTNTEERELMEDIYTESLEQKYADDGEDLYESEPTYEGLCFVGEDQLDDEFYDMKDFFGFYVLNGEFYDSKEDVINK